MKKTLLIFAIIMASVSVIGCKDDNEDFDNGKVHVSNVYNSGCVSSVIAEKSNSIEETFNVYSDGKTVFVSHNNREVNCGYDSIMVHINVVSDTIWVKEIEMGESYANCMCMANTSYQINNLEKGEYTILIKLCENYNPYNNESCSTVKYQTLINL